MRFEKCNKELRDAKIGISDAMKDNMSLHIWQNHSFVKWQKVSGAKEYVLRDDNSNVKEIVYKQGAKLCYRPYVVGKHTITVIAKLNDGKVLRGKFKAREIRMVSSYHTWPSNKFLFHDVEIGFTNLDRDTLKRERSKYVAYYNVDNGWTGVEEEKSDVNADVIISEFLKNYKEAGFNVLNPFTYAIIRSEQQWEGSVLKKVMDKAWYEYGIKTLVLDQTFFELPTKYEWSREQVKQKIEELFGIDGGAIKGYIHHPGFYGINVLDEPFCSKAAGATTTNQIEMAGYCVDVLKGLLDREKVKGRFCCALLRYPYMYRGEKGYKEYLEYWVKYSKSDFINFDVYLPRTTNNDARACIVTLEDFEMTWKCVRDVASKYRLRIDAACTAFDSSNGFSPYKLNKQDVLQNAYYAFAYGAESLMYFVAFPFTDSGCMTRTIFGYDTKPTEIYKWVKKANENIIYLQDRLAEYSFLNSNIKSNESYKDVKICWRKDNKHYAHFYVNMGSTDDKVPTLVFVYAGEEYIYLTRTGKIVNKVAEAETALWVMSGEMVVVFNSMNTVLDRSLIATSNTATLKPHEL